ncbi:hypothetical protein HYQ46_002008 [Verticillium longisporum]|nr:hypothetical protein HYQ46_002008 [Verticillium longisporum]
MKPYKSILPAPAHWKAADSLFQQSRTPFDNSSPIPKKRGPLTIVACSTCRQKRTKCDGHRPVCFACADASFQAAAECFYDLEQGVTRLAALRKEYCELKLRRGKDGPNRLLLSKPGHGDRDVEVPKFKATESYMELGTVSINDEVDILFEDLFDIIEPLDCSSRLSVTSETMLFILKAEMEDWPDEILVKNQQLDWGDDSDPAMFETEPTWPTHRVAPSDDGDALYLRWTPYSMKMPTFRHGRIRILNAGFVLYADVMPDKTLDWTAFQVAVLGGAGDFVSDSWDPMHGSDDDELEGITTWFDDFSFKSEGRLVRARRSVPAGRLGTTHSRRMSDAASSNSAIIADSYRLLRQDVLNTTATAGYRLSREDGMWSPPQSSMMDLFFVGEASIEDIVPMGYNIGHGLAGFLEWASGYS